MVWDTNRSAFTIGQSDRRRLDRVDRAGYVGDCYPLSDRKLAMDRPSGGQLPGRVPPAQTKRKRERETNRSEHDFEEQADRVSRYAELGQGGNHENGDDHELNGPANRDAYIELGQSAIGG